MKLSFTKVPLIFALSVLSLSAGAIEADYTNELSENPFSQYMKYETADVIKVRKLEASYKNILYVPEHHLSQHATRSDVTQIASGVQNANLKATQYGALKLRKICRAVISPATDRFDAVSIAKRLSRINETDTRMRLAAYKELNGRLSEESRRSINSLVESKVPDFSQHQTIDQVAFATNEPDVFLATITPRCRQLLEHDVVELFQSIEESGGHSSITAELEK
ncbi:hypothetical protein [Aliikangiella coralliicola]|uniref:DUF4142 domain-containing protein n=1 Tax=Aliikangiella coralliicola TaxID=2592383 RepID=A0A545UIM1_9GAMM|nr:hypothetical protein [Aliikangiella coralliicola]TQV89305.1 hypothetical protein FLL46_00005 [Aliikangiella coralliicola]